MKNIIIGILIGFVISVVVWNFARKEKSTAPPFVDMAHVKDSLKIDSLNQCIEAQSNLLSKYEISIDKSKSKVRNLTSRLLTEKERADSAEAAYNRTKTIDLCDSTIKTKNNVISTQDSTITELNNECLDYSNSIVILKSQNVAKDSVISILENGIERQNTTIENLNCHKEWAIRHKFWKWLLGWKCEN